MDLNTREAAQLIRAPVTPHAGVWIETLSDNNLYDFDAVTPHAGVWIETEAKCDKIKIYAVTPHAGVWIETFDIYSAGKKLSSLPTRECGLKQYNP